MTITPENSALKFDVVAAGEALARTISSLANDVQSLRREADLQIEAAVNILNADLTELKEINIQISQASTAEQSVPDLQDKQDQIVQRIADQLDINVINGGNGTVELITTSGIMFLDDLPRQITYSASTTVTASSVFGAIATQRLDSAGVAVGAPQNLASSGNSGSVTTSLTSGRLKGLLDTRDTDLANLAAQVESLGTMVRDEVNRLHNQGAGFPAARTLTGTRTVASGDAFQATGNMRIAVLDSAGVVVDTVDIDLTTLGATTVGGLMTQISAGLTTNAAVQIINGNLQIQAAGSTQSIAINDIGSAETGTSRGVSHFLGLNDFFTGTNAQSLAVRSDIVSNPSLVSTAELSTTATVGTAGTVIGDNRAIQKLAAMDDLVFNFSAAGGLPTSLSSLNAFSASIVGFNAVQAADAEQVASREKLLFENIENLLTSKTGVNLDEEMANLILFQNAFEMSARILTIADEMFETLINIIR